MPYLGIFGYLSIFSSLEFFKMQNKKALNLVLKTLDLRIFSQNFEKKFVTFESNILKFVKKQSFVQK